MPKAGRPLKGPQKRIRVSFTLLPHQVEWLKQEAEALDISRSEFLDKLFGEKIQFDPSKGKKLSKIYVPQTKITAFCEKHHVENLSLFGSVLRNDFTKESDIDVLVQFKKDQHPTLFTLSSMERELEEIFGSRKVDLRTPYELNKSFRDDVLREAKVIYEASKK